MLPRKRRQKFFGCGRVVPLDRNAKVRIDCRMRALMKRREPHKHYGSLSAKAYAVGRALLIDFHNGRTGRCFPSYEAIARAADCDRSMVAKHIAALEAAGILTWDNRICRAHDGHDERGQPIIRVVRTSNEYRFIDLNQVCSKLEIKTGTPKPIVNLSSLSSAKVVPRGSDRLEAALAALRRGIGIPSPEFDDRL